MFWAMRAARTGQSHGILATLLVALCLFAGMAPCQRSVAPIDQQPYLQVEGIESVVPALGVCYYQEPYNWNLALRLLKATWHSGKGLRLGISGLDDNGPMDLAGYPSGSTLAPVHVGYDIVFNPKRTAFFFGMVPSCYVEATLGAFPPYAKLAAACDIDYYGAGAGVEVGVVDWNHAEPSLGFHPALYASLKLRLLDAAFRLPSRNN
jgi:hypothetical protein